MGHPAVALPAHMDSRVSTAATDSAPDHVAVAAIRDRRDRCSALLCWLDSVARQPGRASCVFFHHCHGLPWRTRADATGTAIPDDLLRLTVFRWNDRRVVFPPRGPLRILLGRGGSHPFSPCASSPAPPQ